MPYLALSKVPPHALTASERVVTPRLVLRPSKVLLFTLLAATTAIAQNPATPATPAVPRPGNNVPPAPAVPAVAPAPGVPGAAALSPAGADALEPLQFPNTDVKDVLEFYGKKTGRKLIYSNQLVGSIYLSIGP